MMTMMIINRQIPMMNIQVKKRNCLEKLRIKLKISQIARYLVLAKAFTDLVGREFQDEVYAVGSDSDEELANSDIAVSDVEGQEDDDLPDVRAWGKDKRKYYATDYVDPDYGGFQGNDATLAELEEEEARSLQKQLVQQLDDDDFNLDIFVTVRICN